MTTAQIATANTRDLDDTPRQEGIRQRVTAQIIAALEEGVRPWVAPWDTATALGLPLRHNGVAYKGINVIALWAAARAHGYTSRHWLTFKQALALGGAVRRGERGQHIVFYSNGVNAEDGDAEPPQTPRRAVLRSYVVFCADQIDGLPAQFCAAVTSPTADETVLAARFARVPATIQCGGARACYDPKRDIIFMPPRGAFESAALYYATLAHECAHWTGHPARLHRDFTTHAASLAYAREELVAELTAAFVGAELGLPVEHIEDHAAYLKSWLKFLHHDPGALLAAAAKAQAAADYLSAYLFAAEPNA